MLPLHCMMVLSGIFGTSVVIALSDALLPGPVLTVRSVFLNCCSERIPRTFCLTAVLRGLRGASIGFYMGNSRFFI